MKAITPDQKIQKHIQNQQKALEKISNLNSIFSNLGSDPEGNIKMLVKHTNDLLQGACALYNRFDEKEHSLVAWAYDSLPDDFNISDTPEGHICYEVTMNNRNEPVVFEDIKKTMFYNTDPNVKKYGLRSYLGFPVTCEQKAIGALCLVDLKTRNFSDIEILIISTLAKAVSLEEERNLVIEALQKSKERYRLAYGELEQVIIQRTTAYKKAKEEAEQANSAKTEFLMNMSHELRTPLHHVLSYAKFGKTKINSATQEQLTEYFSTIESSGRNLQEILEGLLNLANLESGSVEYQMELMDLRLIIESSIAFHQSQLAEKKISLYFQPSQISTEIIGDKNKLRKVVDELLSNAIKYSPSGHRIRITISSCKIKKGRRSTDQLKEPAIIVKMFDAGVGIPEHELHRIFDSFKQSSFTKTGAGGRGIGLSICSKIIEKHRGQIWAQNNSEGGATFSFTIPYIQ